jgi:HNH endonuclease
MEALKRYRSGGEQKMTVQHVHVAEGGQAIVGNVSASTEGVGARKKSEDQPHAQLAYGTRRCDATPNRSGAGYAAELRPSGGLAFAECMAPAAELLEATGMPSSSRGCDSVLAVAPQGSAQAARPVGRRGGYDYARLRVGRAQSQGPLMDYWQGRCPLTGITDPALMRASHIVPWAECDSDAERLNVHNGLLLSALWDAAFDRALVTFDDDGEPSFSPKLSGPARDELRWRSLITLTDEHRQRLVPHRERWKEQQ